MSINGASPIFSYPSWIVQVPCNDIDPWSQYWPPWWAEMQVSMSLPPQQYQPQQRVNCFCGGSVSYTAIYCVAWFLNRVFNSQSIQYVLVYNCRNIHVLCHTSDVFLRWLFSYRYHFLTMTIKGASTISSLVTWTIKQQCNCVNS